MRPRTLRVGAWYVLPLLWATTVAAGQGDLRLVDAVKHHKMAAADALLRQRVDVNVRQPDGSTSLHWAAHWDELQTAERLIRAGARVSVVNDFGVTPLDLACTNGSARMVDILLAAGANPNAVSQTGETPLMRASRVGNVAVVKTLLARGANVNANEPTEDQTALMWAAAEKHVDVMRALIEAGANVRARSKTLQMPKGFGSNGYESELQPYGGYTPLLFAVREGNVDAVRVLLGAGANVDDTAADGVTPLIAATVRGHVEVASALLDASADPNLDRAGYTALHFAAGVWESSLTSGVVGVEQQPRNEEWMALAGLSGAPKLELVRKLLAHGANPNARVVTNPPRYGYTVCPNNVPMPGATPFFLAALAADIDVMRLLLASGADPKLTLNPSRQATPLMAAAGMFWCVGESRATERESLDATKFVFGLGSSPVNAVTGDGRSAMFGAAGSGFSSVVQFLADSGGDVTLTDRRGSTPVAAAEIVISGVGKPAYPKTAELLRKLGAQR